MRLRATLLVLALATGAALASSLVQRFGPEQAIFCALGKSVEGYDIYCPKPVLNGGWPAPFLVDEPGVSVPNRLSFVEDHWRSGPFVADIAFYAWLVAGAGTALRRVRSDRRGDRR
ncbi:hypothetical protein HJG53_05040 [Sphingomonas sp. ID1715]|uniref:hypothetical protein n=1 Tax=Sphingomonas sp. ID1715 TaxID=1656898 RepID=UPI001489E1DE|nr:hypothetical protein [Sphingomonas sp. ID1715]NNM76268.1 hypothetical protein [Sphingomonas sp. ID1715]